MVDGFPHALSCCFRRSLFDRVLPGLSCSIRVHRLLPRYKAVHGDEHPLVISSTQNIRALTTKIVRAAQGEQHQYGQPQAQGQQGVSKAPPSGERPAAAPSGVDRARTGPVPPLPPPSPPSSANGTTASPGATGASKGASAGSPREEAGVESGPAGGVEESKENGVPGAPPVTERDGNRAGGKKGGPGGVDSSGAGVSGSGSKGSGSVNGGSGTGSSAVNGSGSHSSKKKTKRSSRVRSE